MSSGCGTSETRCTDYAFAKSACICACQPKIADKVYNCCSIVVAGIEQGNEPIMTDS